MIMIHSEVGWCRKVGRNGYGGTREDRSMRVMRDGYRLRKNKVSITDIMQSESVLETSHQKGTDGQAGATRLEHRVLFYRQAAAPPSPSLEP